MESTSDNSTPSNQWRKCNSCKKPILFGAKYYVCSVSTCNAVRTGYVFCSVPCFEIHLPGARHKDAAAIEIKAPIATAQAASQAPASDPKRSIVRSSNSTSTGSSQPHNTKIPREVLIIASRLKEYIHARSEMNTSSNVMDILSDQVRVICDRAIDNARADGRKTVLDRDFSFLKK